MAKGARVLAIDLGASSGRGIVFELVDGKLRQKVIHRFPNGAVKRDDMLFWDLNMLYTEVVKAIELACKEGKLDGIGIDTWGVDFGFVDNDGKVICDDFRNYRNPYNALTRAYIKESVRKLYFHIAGISDNDFNTTYQIIARIKQGESFENVKHILFTPQLLGYMLTGVAVSEPTIASTSGFFVQGKGFDESFLSSLNIPQSMFPEWVDTCSIIEDLKKDIKARLGIDYYLPVIAIPGHDTACAVLGIPSQDEHPLFLSSGTWSLLGALEDKPIINDYAWKYGYTNELGFGGKVRLLRNIMGMWIIQECRRQWISEGENIDYPQIVELARKSADKGAYIDVNDARFALPCNMVDEVKAYVLAKQGIKLESIGEVAQCVYVSLAKAYKDAYDGLVKLTGRKYGKLYIIGGGANNEYLNQIIADTLEMEVSAGPSEASALGNAIGQFVGLGVIKPNQIKKLVQDNFDVKIFLPK